MPRTRRYSGNDESVADQAKSCDDWGKLKMEVLKLKCNQYGLVSTGKKFEVQQRLTAHFATNRNDDDEGVAAVELIDFNAREQVNDDN